MQAEIKKTSDGRLRFRWVKILLILVGLSAPLSVLLFPFPQRAPKNKQPDFLEAEDRQLDQTLHEKQNAVEIVVFYPQEPQTIQSAAKKQAEQLMNTLTAEYVQPSELSAARQEDPDPLLIKADYHTEALAQNTVSVVYLIQKKVGDHIEEERWGYLLDQQTGALVGADRAFDQTGLNRISALFRDAMKNQEATHSLAYSLPMIEATSPIPENFSQFYYADDRLTFFLKLPEGMAISTETEEPKEDVQASGDEMQDSSDNGIERTNPAMSGQEMFFQESQNQLRWSVNRTQLGSHFLLKPAEDREDLFIPPRTIDPDQPMVALTFDDGPHPKNTPRILETLRTYDGASTFFMVGTNVERYPDVVRQVAESGSEIASHTYDHPNLTKLSGDRLNYQLSRVNELIGELTDQQVSVKTLRPPYGAVSEQVREAADTPLILWSMDTLDWKTRDAQKTISYVLEQVEDGDIILMHDIHAESADAAVAIIPQLTAMGYQLVTVQELMQAKGLEMLPGQKIFSGNPDTYGSSVMLTDQ